MLRIYRWFMLHHYKTRLDSLLYSVRHFEIPYDIAEDQIIYYQNKIKELEQ